MNVAAGLQNNSPPLQNLIAVVNTGGGVIVDNTVQIKIPGNVHLTCGGTNASNGVGGSDDYRVFKADGMTLNITHALVISAIFQSLPSFFHRIMNRPVSVSCSGLPRSCA